MLGFQLAGFDVRGVDNDALACQAARYLTGAPVAQMDLVAATPAELAAFSPCPTVVVLSAPCQGNSKCLPKKMSLQPKYKALNRLALDVIKLLAKTVREAWHKKPAFIFFENVSGIKARSNDLLDDVRDTLRALGYVFNEQYHDCGEIGGLAQHRERYLLIARDPEQCPAWVLQPPKQRVLGIAEVLGALPTPIPGSGDGGPMHDLPRVSDLNALRLALIRAGKDWRDLPASVKIGANAAKHGGHYGVMDDTQPAATVLATARMDTGKASTRDRRLNPQVQDKGRFHGAYGVTPNDEAAATVTATADPKRARHSFQEPRVQTSLSARAGRQNGQYGVEQSSTEAHAVVATHRTNVYWSATDEGRVALEDSIPVRYDLAEQAHNGIFGVQDAHQPARTVIHAQTIRNAWGATDEGRVQTSLLPTKHGEAAERQNGAFGVLAGDQPSRTIRANVQQQNQAVAVQDPRLPRAQPRSGGYGVQASGEPSGVILASADTTAGAFATQDPRLSYEPHAGSFGITDTQEPAQTVISRADTFHGPNIADPRTNDTQPETLGALLAGLLETPAPKKPRPVRAGRKKADSHPDDGQPRKGWRMDGALFTPTHRLVQTDDGPRVEWLGVGRPLDLTRTQTPKRSEAHVVILALDNTYHRPLTTLELAVLQSFPPIQHGAWLCFPGTQAQQRKLIGNAIPPAAAYAVAVEVLAALKTTGLGRVFAPEGRQIWTEGDSTFHRLPWGLTLEQHA